MIPLSERKSSYASWVVSALIGQQGRRVMMYLVWLGCNRLFPSKERVVAHRKRDHGGEEEGEIISWNL